MSILNRTSVAAACLSVLLLWSCTPKQSDGRNGARENTELSDLVERQLDAAARDERGLNAFITLNGVGARKRAARLDALTKPGALYGFTVAVKDNIEIAHMPTTAGTPGLADFTPSRDAPVVALLKKAGAVVIGKTNLHELSYGITSNNYAYGAVANVDNTEMFAGGSSGGTAVAVASGFARVGLGTDTGGSVRIPAALNGIYGFRPSMGRYSNDGVVLISNTRDTVGVMARNMDDLIAVDAVLSGDHSSLPGTRVEGLRLGVPRAYFYADLDSEVARMTELALSKLVAAGVVLVEQDLSDVPALNQAVSFPVVLYETARLLPEYLRRNKIGRGVDELIEMIRSPDVKAVVGSALGGAISDEDYRLALEVHRPRLQQAYRSYHEAHKVDAVVFPTTPLPARPIEGSDETVNVDGKEYPTFMTYIRNVDPSSNAGIAGISVPMGRTADGLSVGLEIEVLAGEDKKLLAIARALADVLN